MPRCRAVRQNINDVIGPGERMGEFLRCSQGYVRSSVTDARQTKGGIRGVRMVLQCKIYAPAEKNEGERTAWQ